MRAVSVMGDLLEASKTAKAKLVRDIVRELRGRDFGMTQDGGNGEATASKGLILVKQFYWYNGHRAMQALRREWSPGGSHYKYFEDEFGVTFKVVKSDDKVTGGRMYGKKSDGGVVSIWLDVIPKEAS